MSHTVLLLLLLLPAGVRTQRRRFLPGRAFRGRWGP
jgi:hypothetical protein